MFINIIIIRYRDKDELLRHMSKPECEQRLAEHERAFESLMDRRFNHGDEDDNM